jgi:hypothetical protein
MARQWMAQTIDRVMPMRSKVLHPADFMKFLESWQSYFLLQVNCTKKLSGAAQKFYVR